MSKLVAMLVSLVLLGSGLSVHASSHDSSASAWHVGAFLPVATADLAAVRLDDGSIVAIGGVTALTRHTRTAELLMPGATSWIRLPDAPIDLGTPAVMALNLETVMVVGPSGASGMLAAPSKALLLDVLHRTWTMLPDVPVPLLRPDLVRLDAARVIAVGAVGGAVGAVFDLNAGRWTVIGAPLPNLAGYTTVMLPGQGLMVMITVAIDVHLQPYPVRFAAVLDRGLKWTPLAPPPYTSDGAAAVLLDSNRVLFSGGLSTVNDPAAQATQPLLYYPLTNTWIVADGIGPSHLGGSLTGLGSGRALLIGGHSALGTPTMECLLYSGLTWYSSASLPGPSAGFAVVAVDESHLLLIGGDRAGPTSIGPVSDTFEWSFDAATAA